MGFPWQANRPDEAPFPPAFALPPKPTGDILVAVLANSSN